MSDETWLIARGGGRTERTTRPAIRVALAADALDPRTQALREGDTTWRPLAEIDEFRDVAGMAATGRKRHRRLLWVTAGAGAAVVPLMLIPQPWRLVASLAVAVAGLLVVGVVALREVRSRKN